MAIGRTTRSVSPWGRVYPVSAAVSVLLLVSLLAFAQGGPSQVTADWFSRPSEVPKDVFDLPEFDQFRTGGKLDLERASDFLESLSDSNLPAAQKLFDVFAWKAFVALNWPARSDGLPDPSKTYGDIPLSTPLVWEFWQQSSNIFLPDGGKPVWLGKPDPSLDRYKAGWRQNAAVNEGKQAFSGPLIDQQGNWVHYISFVNQREFNFIVDNTLYNLEGQAEFLRNNIIEFPVNDDASPGSIEIKLAWKVLSPHEISSGRFLTRELPVIPYRPASGVFASDPPAHKSGRVTDNIPGQPRTEVRKTLGLIGMHIAMRTRSSPQWIWATFEQVDNTRLDPRSRDAKHPLPSHPSFANPNNPEALVSANVLPAYNATDSKGNPIEDWDESKILPPVEVLRLVPPPQGTEEVNIAAQAFLGSKGSVLRYYELDGTQWPKHPKAPAVPGGQGSAPESIVRKMPGEVVPVFLTNSTMETYFQKGYQQAGPLEQDDRLASQLSVDTTMLFGTESCVGCHYSAGACIGFRKESTGRLLHDANGNKIPLYGQNGNGGHTGGANFSWMLQIEAKAANPKGQ